MQRPLAVLPPLGGEYGRGLLAGERINGRAQSFFNYLPIIYKERTK